MQGQEVIASLAERFPQLYVRPAEGGEEAWRQAVRRGKAPEGADLAHFQTSPADELREVDTPAGPVEVLFLQNRADFETFLQVVGHKATPVPIARTVGAITYRGLADWGKVRNAHLQFLRAGGSDWAAEFVRIAREEPGSFRSEIVVISEGPYSNIPAGETPYGEEEWLRVSREIRLHHECAHVVCRRTMPDDIDPVWDEVTADVVGLICATGGYEAALAARFLGVTAEGYAGGRLAEYLSEEQTARIDEVASEVYASLLHIEAACGPAEAADPFGFLLALKRTPFVAY